MATNFFQRQDNARRSTKWLVGMFVLAVAGIVGTVMVLTAFGVAEAASNDRSLEANQIAIILAAGAATLVLILGGSLYKISALSGGGTTVAESVGGKRIDRVVVRQGAALLHQAGKLGGRWR